MISGSTPLGGGRWVDGHGGGHGCVGGCPMHACTHAHAHTCMLNMLNMDASMSAAICNFYTCINVCVHVCTCACVWGHPPCPQMPPSTCPLPRAAGSPKHQNSISPELIEIIQSVWRFFTSEHSSTHIDYSWSPWTPPTHLPHTPEPRKPESEELQ